MKLPASEKSSIAELKTGLKWQDLQANNQDAVFPFLPPFWPWESAGAGDGSMESIATTEVPAARVMW